MQVYGALLNASHNASVWGVCKCFCFGYTTISNILLFQPHSTFADIEVDSCGRKKGCALHPTDCTGSYHIFPVLSYLVFQNITAQHVFLVAFLIFKGENSFVDLIIISTRYSEGFVLFILLNLKITRSSVFG